jgi:hypothetical protein
VDSVNNPTQIASGLSANGNMTWTIPSNLKCDTTWKIAVADCENTKECFDIKEFYVKCCNHCDCDRWESNIIEVTLSPIEIDTDILTNLNKSYKDYDVFKRVKTQCGDTLSLKIGNKYRFKAPVFNCQPGENCQAIYSWNVSFGNINQTIIGNPIDWEFNQYGLYQFTITPSCNGIECEPCKFYVNISDCIETCEIFEDFEQYNINDPAGWNVINAINNGVKSNGGNKYIEFKDGSGASYAYKNFSSPLNLQDEGCALRYDMHYTSGINNSPTTDNAIIIYIGPDPANVTKRFVFKLNPMVSTGPGFTTIEVPLSPSPLPTGNSYGNWVASTNTTPSDFNYVLQNASGIAFFLDEGGNPAEIWRFDNFCFKQCCNNDNPEDISTPLKK